MNRSFRKPKRFRLLSICANAVYNVIQSLNDISSIRFFLQRYTRNFEIRRRVLRVKKNDEIKKEHLSLSLSLYLSMHFDFPERMCMYQSLSLSLSIYICKNGLDPGIQERMFRQVKNLFMCDRKYAKCRTKADAYHARIQRGEFLSNTGPDPLKFSKLPSQHSTLGHHRHASQTPFKGVSLAGR